MSLEAEIKALIESSKIEKQLKEKLIVFGSRKNNEFIDWMKSIEKSIVDIKKHDKIWCVVTKLFPLKKICELQRSFLEFKTEFSFTFERFESKFTIYADAIETSKPTDFFPNISTKLIVVAVKIEAEILKQKTNKR